MDLMETWEVHSWFSRGTNRSERSWNCPSLRNISRTVRRRDPSYWTEDKQNFLSYVSYSNSSDTSVTTRWTETMNDRDLKPVNWIEETQRSRQFTSCSSDRVLRVLLIYFITCFVDKYYLSTVKDTITIKLYERTLVLRDYIVTVGPNSSSSIKK